MLDNIYRFMQKEICEQEQLKVKFEKMRSDLSRYDNLRLRGSKKRNVYYFYIQEPGGPRKYLGPESHPDVAGIRKLKYCKEMIASLQNNIDVMEQFMHNYIPVEPAEVQKRIPRLYALTTAQIPSEDDIRKQYLEMKEFKESIPPQYPENLKISTFDGTMVRSKSEALLYERFCAAGFYVLYEFPIEYEPGKYVRADFTLIHPKTGRILLWEHLGLWFHKDVMSNYRRNYLIKTDTFKELGFVQGINFLVSFETDWGIDMEQISQSIDALYNQPITMQERKLQQKQKPYFQRGPLLKESSLQSKVSEMI